MREKNELIRVFPGTEISVILLNGELGGIGVTARIQNDFQSGVTGGFMGGTPSGVDLYIQLSDLEKAEPIINEFIKNNKG